MIPNQWYAISLSPDVSQKKLLGIKRMGEPLLLFRDSNRRVVCLQDRCAHKGTKLSLGRFVDGQIACPYHGFRYDTQGECTHVPALGQNGRVPKGLCTKRYRVAEKYDLVWLWWGDDRPEEELPEIPMFEEWKTYRGHGTGAWEVPLHYTQYVASLSEFYHAPFVHLNYWFHLLFNYWNPRGVFVSDYKCEVNGNLIRSEFLLRHENDKNAFERQGLRRFLPWTKQWKFHVDLLMPNLNHFMTGPFDGISISTPIDDNRSWVILRARWLVDVPFLPAALVDFVKTQLVHAEVRYNIWWEQPLDVRLMLSQSRKSEEVGTNRFIAVDGVHSHYVRLREKLKQEALTMSLTRQGSQWAVTKSQGGQAAVASAAQSS